MQIQRVIDESMAIGEEDKKTKNFVDARSDETTKFSSTVSIASVSSTEVTESATGNALVAELPEVAEVVSANRSFLHGQESGQVAANINERSMNERVVYATLDSLALKRARLPLQLVPIDENAATCERKEKNVGEKRIVNASRKASSKRPSFKVRPGIPLPGQWKSRTRSTPRSPTASIGKFDNISKDLVGRLIIFENIIRNNNRTCAKSGDESTTTTTTNVAKEEIVDSPKVKVNLDKSTNVNHSSSRQDSSEKMNSHEEIVEKYRRESNDSDLEKMKNPMEDKESKVVREKNEIKKLIFDSQNEKKIVEFIETKYMENASNQRHNLDTIAIREIVDDLRAKEITPKSEYPYAKNVLQSLPVTGSSLKRGKKSKNLSKNREKHSETSSRLEASRSKNFSREDLRNVTISLPTNFVHLASATNSRLLTERGEDTLGFSKKPVIEHEEKCAELEYLGGGGNYQEIEMSGSSRKSVRNSSSIDEKTSCSWIEENFAESRLAGGLEESAAAVSSSSPSSSSSSLEITSIDNANYTTKPAKVLTLENSQGVPEVVKRSENEGNVEAVRQDRESTDKRTTERIDDEIIAPVYEAMYEFSISRFTDVAPVENAGAATREANTSFLWGGRDSRRYEKNRFFDAWTDNEEIVDARAMRNDVERNDNSIDDNGYDAYDDVGLSREDTEEDHYDDVGLPFATTKSSSTATLFEEINVDADSELYDDVLPAPIVQTSTSAINAVVNKNDGNASSNDVVIDSSNSRNAKRSEKVDAQTRKESSSSRSLENDEFTENDENPYLSIGNDYSSVEEGLDDFEDGQDDALYDDVELPSQDRVNSLYAGSSSGSQLGSLYNGKESEWEDLEEAAPVLPSPKKNNVALRNLDCQTTASKKKTIQRWSRKVRRQKSKASRKNPSSRSTSRTAATRGTSTFSDTASDDSNYETLGSFPSDEFSSGSDDEDSSGNPSRSPNGVSGLQNRINEISQEAPSRPVPPPPRESSLTETFGKRMKMLRRTWSITKGSLGRMRRRTSATVETDVCTYEGGKYTNNEQPSPNNDGRKYFSFKKHFRKSLTGLSTFYLENDSSDERLSRNNNRSSKEEVYSNGSNNSWYTGNDYWKNGVSEQSQRNDVDHYSMLDEEPLYQFYAAAAARVAFESDSEGYEEVEDPMPSPSAVDLAKPGHRTLWCQTPQVINSDLLHRLSPDEKKVQEAKFEIFTSEASYLNSLRVLVDEFLNNHELVYEVLTPSEREKLFGGVPSVLIASERLLAELETVWREDVMMRGLPDVLLNYAQRSSSVYVAYCSNQVSIDTTLKELRSKKGSKFIETVTRIESHAACQSLSLHSFLMLPMQRVTRLPLLADAVLSKLSSDSKDERTCWECVLSQLSQVVMECNEGARAAGRLSEMEALERKLEYSSKVPPIVLRDRYLVRRGPVVQMLARADAEYKLTFGKKYHKASLYLLLLTDYLLIAKSKSNTNEETYTVIDTCKRSLVALEKVPEDSPFAGRHAMVLSLLENYSGRHVEYILTCNNATERERWLDAVSPPKPSLVGETLYETWDCPQVMALYPYAAAQPDELTLQPGDVINVLRKMTDGWHLGEKLLGSEQGWFPGNYAKEVSSEHVRARNLRQRHRLLALSASVMQQLAKQSRVH